MTESGTDELDQALERACAVCDTMLLNAPDYDAPPVWTAVGALSDWAEEQSGLRSGFGPANDLRESGLLDREDARMELLTAALKVCAQFEMIRSASTSEYSRDMEWCGKLLEYYLEVRATT